MPREKIHSCEADPKWEPKVGWGSNMSNYVQLGVDSDAGRSLIWQLYADRNMPDLEDRLARIAAAVTDALLVVDKEEHRAGDKGRAILNAFDSIAVYSGLWTDLDRKGINALIKLLRRARDAAFGRDE